MDPMGIHINAPTFQSCLTFQLSNTFSTASEKKFNILKCFARTSMVEHIKAALRDHTLKLPKQIAKRKYLCATSSCNHHVSSDENPADIPLYWLVNRDPYIGLL